MNTKTCTKCGEEQSLEGYYKRGDKKGCGLQSSCKSCVRKKTKEHKLKNKDWYRDYYLKKGTGASLAQYNLMFAAQEGKCAICEVHQSTQRRALDVDHCHSTGKIRGLLCETCNKVLGNFQDDVSKFEAAIAYLELNRSLLSANAEKGRVAI